MCHIRIRIERRGRSSARHLRPCVVGEAVVFVRRVVEEIRVVAGHCHQERIARVRLFYVHLTNKQSAFDRWVGVWKITRVKFDGAPFCGTALPAAFAR